jgi:hypothetical protein
MADVSGKFFSAKKVRTGVSPSSPGVEVGETLPPVNPPGGGLNSVGLTMPSAFAVANSPLTSNGTLEVTGAGTVAQYVRGDGSLADFPATTGGGASVSYYLNGSVSQGTIGGVAYREFNRMPVFGTGTDISISSDGYIASFITDAGDPNKLLIPAGNWNLETYFSASSNGGSPTFYVELYKYDGTTFTLIASSAAAPELIAFGTNLNPYFSTLAVPQTTLALTDRLALRYYVNTSGRTITLHTENDHLCQVITTFTTGLTALNGLTAQVQFFAVGTSGTDFNIASATDTHTFNLPTASSTNRGALSSADWALFTQAYNDKINSASVTGTTTKTLTLTQQDGGTITASWTDLNTDAVLSVFGRTGAVVAANGDYTTAQVTESGNLYYTDGRARGALSFAAGSGAYNSSTGVITIPTNNNQITNGAGYITSAALAGYLPLTGGTLTGPLGGTSASFTDYLTVTRATDSIVFLNTTGTNQATGLVNQQSGTNRWGFGTNFGSADDSWNVYNYTAATRYLTILSSGAFGINTNNPARQFVVSNAGANGLEITPVSSGSIMEVITYNRSTSAYTPLQFESSVYTFNRGNVLVGTTTDSGFKLDVNGTGRFSGTSGAFIGLTINNTDSTGSARLRVTSTGGNINDFSSFSASHPSRANQAWIGGDGSSTVTVLQAGGNEFLRGASTGAATFSSSVFAGGGTLSSPSGADTIIGAYGGQDCSLILQDANQLWEIYVNDDFYINRGSTNVLSLNRTTGTATFSSSVFAGGSILTSPSGADTIIGAYGGQDCSLILQDANQLWELYVNDDFYINRGSTNVLTALRSNGNVIINSLSGSGNRIVVANSGGTLISAVIGSGLAFDGTTLTATGGSSGSISGSGTSGTISLFTGSTSIGNSVITESSGNIGINISSPFSKLHVRNSDTNEGTIAVGHQIYPGLIFSSANTGEFRIDNRSSAGGGFITFYPNGQQNTLGNEAMRIATNGNVGIGTNSPSYLFTVGKAGTTQDSVIQIASTTTGTGSLYFGDTTGTFFGSSMGGFQYSHFNDLMVVLTAGGERMRILSSGNVLIGTTTDVSGAKLNVNGAIRTGTLDTGYVPGNWKLGRAILGTQPTETYQIIVEINGVLYAIGAANI